jgi:hypothetical protein
MTTYTQSDLAIRLLRDLGLVGAEETPSAPDLLFAEETIVGEIESMTAEGIMLWGGSYDSIPGEYYTPLARRIGLALVPSFGLGSLADATGAISVADRKLRAISSVPGTGEPQHVEYY